MNYKAIILSAILGISTPAIIDMAIPSQAMAVQKFNYPAGEFSDKEWKVTLSFDNNVYYYNGENLKSNNNINLSGIDCTLIHFNLRLSYVYCFLNKI